MRLRKVKKADDIIASSSYFINNPSDYIGKWNELFGNNNPLYIEIGMGKGNFLKEMALKHPNINFVGIEKYSSVIVRAVQKMDEVELPNVKLICVDALLLPTIFSKEVDTIFLNFSDPWPKERHAKRRLTSDIFLNIYDKLFKDKKRIVLKTDNVKLYEYSMDQFENHNYDIKVIKYDINSMPEDNVMTEYEERFLNNNNSIHKIEAIKK
ncbi:MAG TPA: tRNA (guanosine(46)-N7)-methyltransferase TrmB [Mollicutes bacterium]|nr:tRNA (guanosine(46)-N7)-methyltransferase TrmB [Mollicutes bacterium]